jgi:hypothetical protein
MPSNLTAPPESSIYPSLVTIQRILPGSSSVLTNSVAYPEITGTVIFFEFRGEACHQLILAASETFTGM